MADDVTLLPCPFCGGTPYVNDNDIWTYMECECGAQGPQADTKAEAREVWNTRVSDLRIAALEAQLADARDCIDLFNRIIVRAECKWKEAHPDSAFYPDVPDLILWLKEQVDKLAERRCETCKQYLSGYWCMTHRYSPNVNASCSDWQGEET